MTNSLGKAVCDIEGCGNVQPFTAALEGVEVKRMLPRFLAVAGWLHVGSDYCCPRCSSVLRGSLNYIDDAKKAAAVRRAISDALFLQRVEVVNR